MVDSGGRGEGERRNLPRSRRRSHLVVEWIQPVGSGTLRGLRRQASVRSVSVGGSCGHHLGLAPVRLLDVETGATSLRFDVECVDRWCLWRMVSLLAGNCALRDRERTGLAETSSHAPRNAPRPASFPPASADLGRMDQGGHGGRVPAREPHGPAHRRRGTLSRPPRHRRNHGPRWHELSLDSARRMAMVSFASSNDRTRRGNSPEPCSPRGLTYDGHG